MSFKKSLGKALSQIENGDFDKGIRSLEAMKKKHSNEVSLRNLLGVIYFKLGKYKPAYREFSDAVKLDVDNIELQHNLDLTMHALVGDPEDFDTCLLSNDVVVF